MGSGIRVSDQQVLTLEEMEKWIDMLREIQIGKFKIKLFVEIMVSSLSIF
jgi:hypothetical protein